MNLVKEELMNSEVTFLAISLHYSSQVCTNVGVYVFAIKMLSHFTLKIKTT